MVTKSLFLDNSKLFSIQAIVKDVIAHTKYPFAVVLNETIFYPQGGGQPTDKGILKSENSAFKVEFVTQENDKILHCGNFVNSNIFSAGDLVMLEIDKEDREFNMKNHSAGHLIGDMIDSLSLGIECVKGYHFRDSPYVEYKGKIESKQEIIEKVNKLCALAIEQGLAYSVTYVKSVDLPEDIKKTVSPRILETCEYIRLVQIEGYPPCPCGGTHISSTNELKRVFMRKIDTNKDRIRFCYSFE